MDLGAAVAQGAANPVLLIATALVLGALHGLEPGHSKTMMAAFIVAVRGSVRQAVLLGLSAAFSHTIIVWVLALAALSYGQDLAGEGFEHWFLLASGVLTVLIGLWIFARTWRAHAARRAHSHRH